MKQFFDKKNNKRITIVSDKQLLNYIVKNNLNISDLEFLFDDQYNDQNINN